VTSIVWTRVVRCSTSPTVIGGEAFLAAGAVANTDPSRHRVFWIDSVHERMSAFWQMLRAKPNAEFNSSTEPYASTRRSALETRTPPASPVCPPSPCFVAMLISLLLSKPTEAVRPSANARTSRIGVFNRDLVDMTCVERHDRSEVLCRIPSFLLGQPAPAR
jgi:hypothetical protein